MIALVRSRTLSVDPIAGWSLAGIAAFAVLPWYGLEYGLWEATWDEIYDALSWRSANLSLLPLTAKRAASAPRSSAPCSAPCSPSPSRGLAMWAATPS